MADLAVWQRTIVDEKGNIIPGAEVSVRSYPGGSLITLYEGPGGTKIKGNPFSTGADGFARFWAESQRAEIVAYGAGSTIRWVVDLLNADEVIGDAISEATAAAAVAVGEAEAAADRAEAARDAAIFNANVYEDVASGLAATSNGDQFIVLSGDSFLRYRNDSGAAVLVAQFNINEVHGDNGLFIDSTRASLPVEVQSDNPDAVVFADDRGRRLLTLDSDEGRAVLSRLTIVSDDEPLLDVRDRHLDVRRLAVGSDGDTATEHTSRSAVEIPKSKNALVIADTSGRGIYVDSESGVIRSEYQIVEDLEPRPILVPVEYGPTLLRGTDAAPYALENRPYQATPSISFTGDRLWATWRADLVVGENPGNFIVLAWSDDGGVTFTELGVVTYTDSNDYQIVDPMLWTDPEGVLWLWFGIFVGGNVSQVNVSGFWAMTCKNPEAEITHWSKSFRMSYYGDPRRAVKIDEDWWIAVDTWGSETGHLPAFPDKIGPRICRLDYRNRRIVPLFRLPPNQKNGNYGGFFETEITQLSNGDLLATNRVSDGLVRTVSTDGGQTWSDFDYYMVLGEVSASRIWLGPTPSGRLAICYNNDMVRQTLTLALSEDDGETFPYSVVIEPGPTLTYSYPVIDFQGDDIYIIYDTARGTLGQIRVAKVKESEVIAGTSVPVINIISDPGGN